MLVGATSRRVVPMALFLVVGCETGDAICEGPESVMDTSGVTFRFDREQCIAVADDTTPLAGCQDPGNESFMNAFGRFAEIAIACGNGWTREQVRPLACEADEDCPEFRTNVSWRYECRAGLCQNIETDRYPPELVVPEWATLLCDAPLPRGTWYQGPDPCPGDVAADEACPLPLPADCIDPR